MWEGDKKTKAQNSRVQKHVICMCELRGNGRGQQEGHLLGWVRLLLLFVCVSFFHDFSCPTDFMMRYAAASSADNLGSTTSARGSFSASLF